MERLVKNIFIGLQQVNSINLLYLLLAPLLLCVQKISRKAPTCEGKHNSIHVISPLHRTKNLSKFDEIIFPMDITFFKTAAEFRKWLKKNHKKEKELVVGFYKTKSGKQSITWPESVDEALCFGWIDAMRKSIDEESYYIRFTQRKADSIWSKININKMEELIKNGLVQTAGLEAYKKRSEKKSGVYSYENETVNLSKDFEKKLKADKKAWEFFQSQAPSYRKVAGRWVMTAKQEATRIKRLNELIDDSRAQMKIKVLRYGKKM